VLDAVFRMQMHHYTVALNSAILSQLSIFCWDISVWMMNVALPCLDHTT